MQHLLFWRHIHAHQHQRWRILGPADRVSDQTIYRNKVPTLHYQSLSRSFSPGHEKQQNEVWRHTCPTAKGNCNGPLYLRFIDDGLAVWEHHSSSSLDKELLQALKSAINDSGLKWTFTTLSNEVEFMDLTITFEEGAFLTNLYEKPLALHLYIPPHSCHPPGCFNGLVAGMVLRIYRMWSLYCHLSHQRIGQGLYGHLLDRGYPHATIKPLFVKTQNSQEGRRIHVLHQKIHPATQSLVPKG